jgi:hypothetical protein
MNMDKYILDKRWIMDFRKSQCVFMFLAMSVVTGYSTASEVRDLAKPVDEVAIEETQQDYSEAFIAAGFESIEGEWLSDCGKDSIVLNAAYSPGRVQKIIDLNGDGLYEIILSEGSSLCAGNTGVVTYIMLRNMEGEWIVLEEFIGFPHILDTRSTAGWLDIKIVGPGFCHVVISYVNGSYNFNRTEYNGKPCDR